MRTRDWASVAGCWAAVVALATSTTQMTTSGRAEARGWRRSDGGVLQPMTMRMTTIARRAARARGQTILTISATSDPAAGRATARVLVTAMTAAAMTAVARHRARVGGVAGARATRTTIGSLTLRDQMTDGSALRQDEHEGFEGREAHT